MTELKKITAFVPAKLLDAATAETGLGVTETLRIALEKVTREGAYRRLREARGKIRFDGPSLDELREDRDFDERGDVVDRG
ncbi:MAG TPA: hypothetical protein VG939_09785 [Caulobacteraceae bacterium]|nr:hypothetical protein [Caulobacteraceae bacterium]